MVIDIKLNAFYAITESSHHLYVTFVTLWQNTIMVTSLSVILFFDALLVISPWRRIILFADGFILIPMCLTSVGYERMIDKFEMQSR